MFNTRHWTSPLRPDADLGYSTSNSNVKNSEGLGSSQYCSLKLLHRSHLWSVLLGLSGCGGIDETVSSLLGVVESAWWPRDFQPGPARRIIYQNKQTNKQHRRWDNWVRQSSPWRSEECSRWWIQERRNEDAVGRMGRHSAFCSKHRIRGGSKAAAAVKNNSSEPTGSWATRIWSLRHCFQKAFLIFQWKCEILTLTLSRGEVLQWLEMNTAYSVLPLYRDSNPYQ